MNATIPEAFQHHLGLSSIALGDDSADATLPQDSRLQPIDASVEARLRHLLRADTFDAMILDAVRPQAFDRTVLSPSRFHLLRAGIMERLAELVPLAQAPAEAAELQAALALLRIRSHEHELGEALRYALIKG